MNILNELTKKNTRKCIKELTELHKTMNNVNLDLGYWVKPSFSISYKSIDGNIYHDQEVEIIFKKTGWLDIKEKYNGSKNCYFEDHSYIETILVVDKISFDVAIADFKKRVNMIAKKTLLLDTEIV